MYGQRKFIDNVNFQDRVRAWGTQRMRNNTLGVAALPMSHALRKLVARQRTVKGAKKTLTWSFVLANNIAIGVPGYSSMVEYFFNEPSFREAIETIGHRKADEIADVLLAMASNEPKPPRTPPTNHVEGPTINSSSAEIEASAPNDPQTIDPEDGTHKDLQLQRSLLRLVTEKFFAKPSSGRQVFFDVASDPRLNEICKLAAVRSESHEICAQLTKIEYLRQSWRMVIAEYNLKPESENQLLKVLETNLDELANWFRRTSGIAM
jgi:hypothetical protein